MTAKCCCDNGAWSICSPSGFPHDYAPEGTPITQCTGGGATETGPASLYMVDTCRGLAYLHSEQPPVIHHDVNSYIHLYHHFSINHHTGPIVYWTIS